MITNKRQTSQKTKILQYLKSVKSHPTAETIYKAVRKDLPNISLATVYRNLNQMADEGIILRFKIGNEFRFDGCTDCHQHCICIRSKKIIDADDPKITEYALKHLKVKGFRPTNVQIIYEGYLE